MRYRLTYERQAYERPDGSFLFWGGLHVGNVGGGEGLIADEIAAAERAGIDIRFAHAALDLLQEDGHVVGVVVVKTPHGVSELSTRRSGRCCGQRSTRCRAAVRSLRTHSRS